MGLIKEETDSDKFYAKVMVVNVLALVLLAVIFLISPEVKVRQLRREFDALADRVQKLENRSMDCSFIEEDGT